MKAWYPEESGRIERYRDTVIAHVLDGALIPADSPIWSERQVARAATGPAPTLGLTASPCARELLSFFGECGIFFAIVAGAWNAARFTALVDRALLSMVAAAPEYVAEVMPLLKAFKAAEGALEKAKALAPIAKKLWDFGFMKTVFDVIKFNSSIWDWLIDGAVALGQIVMWLATEFVAAIAEVAVVILSAVRLIRAAEDTYAICK